MTKPPITPPPELVQQWEAEHFRNCGWVDASGDTSGIRKAIATQAARWGADQELEACCEWLDKEIGPVDSCDLRADRRPKPPSLKDQALEALNQADEGLNESEWQQRSDTIRRALEALPND
jgi:hypothetical protein